MPGAPNFNTSEVRTNASIRVEPISPLPLAFVWCQNVSGFPREIDFQELQERLFQRNGAPVLVLGREIRVAEDVEQTFPQIEPFNLCFADFLSPKSGVKTAMKDKGEIGRCVFPRRTVRFTGSG